MESKTWSKFSHIIVFFLLATSFETLMARSDGQQVIQLMQSICKGKQRWPELVGVPTKMAEEIIKKENPNIQDVPVLLAGSPVTLDFRCFRVRLFRNILNYVVNEPVVT